MDGGRVLRALLAMRMNYARATRIAAGLGQSLAVLFGLAGFLGNPFLIFIAIFIWIGAAQESAAVQAKSSLEGAQVSAAMITEFRHLTPHDPISRAVELVLAGSQHDFPVMEGEKTVGMLTRDGLFQALGHNGREKRVRDLMVRNFEIVESNDALASALERMQGSASPTLAVNRNGRLVGLLTAENVAEYLIIKNALAGGSFQTAG
jgi:predicted transcriptional regulator